MQALAYPAILNVYQIGFLFCIFANNIKSYGSNKQ